mmetsp:Transcript_31414/g.88538  ORF Transcript_31414/g.88538 Transcript_31414/m.88538 type:complete len:251 (+) Transcript_31414:469-1221(+)
MISRALICSPRASAGRSGWVTGVKTRLRTDEIRPALPAWTTAWGTGRRSALATWCRETTSSGQEVPTVTLTISAAPPRVHICRERRWTPHLGRWSEPMSRLQRCRSRRPRNTGGGRSASTSTNSQAARRPRGRSAAASEAAAPGSRPSPERRANTMGRSVARRRAASCALTYPGSWLDSRSTLSSTASAPCVAPGRRGSTWATSGTASGRTNESSSKRGLGPSPVTLCAKAAKSRRSPSQSWSPRRRWKS